VHADIVLLQQVLQVGVLFIIREGHAVKAGLIDDISDQRAAAELDIIRVCAQKEHGFTEKSHIMIHWLLTWWR